MFHVTRLLHSAQTFPSWRIGYVYTLVETVDTIFLPSLHLKHRDNCITL